MKKKKLEAKRRMKLEKFLAKYSVNVEVERGRTEPGHVSRKVRHLRACRRENLASAMRARVPLLPQALLVKLRAAEKNPTGRIHLSQDVWAETTRDPVVRKWVRQGCPLPAVKFSRRVVLPNPVQAEEEARACDAEVSNLVESGAAYPCAETDVHLVSPIFVVPKATPGKWRLIHDLRVLNLLVRAVSFRLLGLFQVPRIAKKGDFAFSWDLKSGYAHVLMEPAARRALGFQWRGVTYAMRVLPFGLAIAPYVFQRIMNAAMAKLRSRAVRVLGYLDDFIVFASSRRQALAARNKVHKLLERFGLVREPTKGNWEPTQVLDWLGLRLDLRVGTFAVTESKLGKLKKVAGHVIAAARSRRPIRVKEVMACNGLVESLRLAAPFAPLCVRSAQLAVRGRVWPGKKVRLSRRVGADLQVLLDMVVARPFAPIWQAQPQVKQPVLFTDAASEHGWGAILRFPSGEELEAHGSWSKEERAAHINVLEAEAVRLGLASFRRHLAGKPFQLATDSSAVWWAMSRMRSRSLATASTVLQVVRSLWAMRSELAKIWWVPSLENPADAPSRVKDHNEWSLAPDKFAQVVRKWGWPKVDLFASRAAHVVGTYVARGQDPGAIAADALALPRWGPHLCYANPPWPLLSVTVGKLLASRCGVNMILVTPWWPSATWFPVLLQVAADRLIWPIGDHCFVSQDGKEPAVRWPVVVWRVRA